MSSELQPSSSSSASDTDTDTDAAAPAPAPVSQVAPGERAAFVLPTLDLNVARTRKVDAEVDAALPPAVAPLSGDRKPEWGTRVRTRPRGGEVGAVGVAVVEKEPRTADEDESTDS